MTLVKFAPGNNSKVIKTSYNELLESVLIPINFYPNYY